ncbi:Moenomycin biosynthesis protein MoeN5 [Actinoplanes teichomyceticus]|uniref:Prenyltransferase n=1 Tax=Actinoplanes teichomyceticus TaxID=1867 RepID=A0A1B1ESN1_ACTTI|nr:Moenomycin biosynthesis protein MoeN5 [Actinoplanes teichomyceticus]ANQ31715.1 prenyltransferase [Actinoplanes teichomyceticus]TWG14686.1 hypothetical protein FHX34_104992 [Actinoplanes teichomyceticus]GIF10089.1 hypothetical protein Ate01nite_01210 [Actinoplanes teichomyceticus]
MSSAPAAYLVPDGVPRDLAAELDDAHRYVSGLLMDTMEEFRASPELVRYVGDLRLYLRAACLLTMWLPEERLRREVAGEIAMHIAAMKLFDDLLDDDSGFDRFELALCLLLEQRAVSRLAGRADDPRAVLRTVEDNFVTVGLGQLRTKQVPAVDLASWRAHAETYGGCFLSLYGTLAALAGRRPQACAAATDFGWGFGMIVTIADDLRDYERHGERTGNLGHLLRTGRVTEAELRGLLEEARRRATPPADVWCAHDLRPIIDRYADDVLERGLPVLLALPDDRPPPAGGHH